MLFNFLQKYIILGSVLLNSIYTINSQVEPITNNLSSIGQQKDIKGLRLWLTVSAEKRYLEISWNGAPAEDGDYIILAQEETIAYERENLKMKLMQMTQKSLRRNIKENNSNHTDSYWISSEPSNGILLALKPMVKSSWFSTGIYFDNKLLNNITIYTSCYGYWASYVNNFGLILSRTCLRAYPTWMVDIRSSIGSLRIRDLFIPGTHDSGSYSTNPNLKDTIVTKYTLTQDDDIFTQLLHGIRYLDIRVGYYRNTETLFYVNHGITRLKPLIDIINQVIDFVEDTNEIVIFGLKEFPVGFGRNLTIHHKLVDFLATKFGNLIVHPSVTWKASLNDIWARKQNVILAYDKSVIVNMYPHTLFTSVEQRWGNVQTWSELEHYLKIINTYDSSRMSDRPIADMAELTPETWDIILNRYGGLRHMADRVNWRVSQLYRDYLLHTANIVAVDFYRGTTIIDLAINWNKRGLKT